MGSVSPRANFLLAWAALADYCRWTDEQGCPVRVDVVADLFGPERRGWQTVEFITIGEPFGTTIGVDTRLDTSRRFAWDPTECSRPSRSLLEPWSAAPSKRYST